MSVPQDSKEIRLKADVWVNEARNTVKRTVFERNHPMFEKKRIVFLCTGNTCRSQMAEAWTNHLLRDGFEAYSAGTQPKDIDPYAVEAMSETGIDISGQKSKDIESLGNLEFEYVVTLCDHARESCPYFPAKTKLMHHGFDDPPALAVDAGSEEEAMVHYRRVRDEIKDFVKRLPQGFAGHMDGRASKTDS
jgi:arsenate reductase